MSSYPVVHSLLDGAALGGLVERDFGLQARGGVPLIQCGLNDHYALSSDQGEFVIRVYRHGWRSPEDIQWELDLVDHLSRSGAPVATCVPRRDGRLFSEIYVAEGVRQVSVFKCAPGRYTHFGNNGPNRVSPAECAEAFGISAAEVHAAADGFSARTSRFALDLDHLLDGPLRAILREYPHRREDIEALRRLTVPLRERLAEAPSALDRGPCHGDMSGGNSTYENGRVFHFDFDCGGPGWRAYDLGVFFWSMSIHGHGAEVWDRFLRGYRSRRALSDTDAALVGAFAGVRVLWLMGLWCANVSMFGRHRLHEDYFDRESARAQDFLIGMSD